MKPKIVAMICGRLMVCFHHKFSCWLCVLHHRILLNEFPISVSILILIGIDLLVTLKNNEDANKMMEERECSVSREMHSDIYLNGDKDDFQSDEMNECEMNDKHEEETEQSISETRTAVASIEENNEEDDESSSEHELTNLGWLIDLKNLTQWPVDSNTSNRKNSTGNANSTLVNGIGSCIMNDIDDEDNAAAPAISEKDLSEERFKKFTIQVKQ